MKNSFKNIQYPTFFICIMLNATLIQSAPFVYVANSVTGSNSVSVIDAATDQVIKTINTNSSTFLGAQMAITPDGKTLYSPFNVNNSGVFTGGAARIDTATNEFLNPVENLGSNTFAIALQITPDGKYAYMTYGIVPSLPLYVAKINIATNTIDNTIFISNGAATPFITIAPNGLTAYISSTPGLNNPEIAILDLTNDNIAPAIPLPMGFNRIEQTAVSPDNQYLYVCTSQGQRILQYDLSDRLAPTFIQEINTSPLQPYGIIITADGRTLYFTGRDSFNPDAIGTIDISNPLMPMMGTQISLAANSDPSLLALTPDQQSLYATLTMSNGSTLAINTTNPSNPAVRTAIEVGGDPIAIAITPSNSAPANLTGCRTQNRFLLQTDFINKLTWSAPAAGQTPASYKIYRDAALTELAGTSTAPEFYDHGRNPSIFYSYYVTAVDSNGSESLPASITVTQSC